MLTAILRHLRSLAADSASKLDVLGHDSDALGVDSSQVGVFEQTDEVSLGRLLKSENGRALEAKISLVILSDFTNKSLERKLAD